ncbi:fasciclin domain-containing protein [Zeaxanthinibacter enoshimensis]|uniref:Putative surface protein with fasciclin (FAS1) repeats n=1 Tax=Zeaxanthinibacter enoshimensis TaxID=392009 RepID=A0A4R6TLK0_9FLAO|nr:fasciclin domain-containing protein [Zeaxanthinibacter enoshimensis]TDQ31587.1 putative surface protein with fasciclin (FAS1) repeats [Zeaxanthinibacter enoshimensis]
MNTMKAMLAGSALLCTLLTSAQYDPSTYGEIGPAYSIVETTVESDKHKTLMAAVMAAGLADRLHSGGPYTVFAPSDEAFETLTEDRLKTLLRPENKKELKALLTYHMIAGKITASDILKAMCRGEGSASFTTLQGNKLRATMDGIDIVLTDCLGNSARITNADSDQCNGVIHVIDRVIAPR